MRSFSLLRAAVACLIVSTCALATHAQDATATADTVKPWKTAVVGSFNATQVGFTNWAAGGQNSIAFAALSNFAADYHKGRWSWNSLIDLGYGEAKIEDDPFRKNEDKIDILTRVGYEARKNLYYVARANLKTQFAPGYNLPDDSTVISRFMAPGFLLASLGMEYRPSDGLSINFSPVTNKTTFVLDQTLADAGAFGVRAAEYDSVGETRVKRRDGETIRAEFGALLGVQYKQTFKNVTVQSRLELFNNYSDANTPNRRNIDVNWENLISVSVNKWLAVNFFLHMIYDDDINVAEFKKVNGEEVQVGARPILQIKQTLGVGLTYKLAKPKPDSR